MTAAHGAPDEEHIEDTADEPDVGDESSWAAIRQVLRDPLTAFFVVFLLLILGAALAADFVAPFDPLKQSLRDRALPPLTESARGLHFLGTDELGRDVLSRLIHGARPSLAVGLLGALGSAFIGVTAGIIAGYYGGIRDQATMRLVDSMQAIPTLLVALFILFLFGRGFINLLVIFAIVRWVVYARVVRSRVLSLRESTFILAERAIGCSDFRIITRHILPNLWSTIIVIFTLEVAVVMLAEAALSFLGFGIQPPAASWGVMMAKGRSYIDSAWWLVTFPGLAIFLTVLSLNVITASMRTALDPVHRWRWFVGTDTE